MKILKNILIVILFIAACAALVGLNGCGSTVIQETTVHSLTPDVADYFTAGEATIMCDTDEKYSLNIVDYDVEDYKDYVYACKDSGWVDVVYDDDLHFGAYTEDNKYWIQCTKDLPNNTLYIICQVVEEE